MGVLNDIALWLWRLIPANPILVRVVSVGGKRTRHLLARLVYLGVLFGVVMIGGGGALGGGAASLSDLAIRATRTFMVVSVVQLFLMSFLSPIFAAAAITQEKDANTFNILLTTPLSDGQIVFGTLLSRLYFVIVLLISGLPIFCITMLYGGVTTTEVFESFMLSACTATVTGALAIFISVVRVGTRKTIFSFFVGIAAYLIAVGWLGLSGATAVPQAEVGQVMGTPTQMSWLAPIHPFLSLLVVTGQTPAPKSGDLTGHVGLARWLLSSPQYGYMAITLLSSLVLVVSSLLFLRSGAREGEITFFSRIKGAFSRGDGTGEKRRKPRHVWDNPIAWREAATRGSTGGRAASRWVVIALGLLGAVALLAAHENGWWGLSRAAPRVTAGYLTALVWIELAIMLLIVTTTAATTLTRERESLTMEMLLTTPLTSKYILYGMLRGLVSFVVPLIALPAATLTLFAIADLARGSAGGAVTTPEAIVLVPLLMLAVASASALMGLSMSLRCKKTVQSTLTSVGVLVGFCLITWACGAASSSAGGIMSAVVAPALPFPAMGVLVDHHSAFSSALVSGPPTPSALIQARVTRVITAVAAAAVYSLLAYSVFSGLVRDFDRTVRKQSA